ncbi:MAG: DNA-binding protein [SAR202 cluster bacterium]|jgi:hypothetical protein|nr:DNA-binding protein [SAR202 cluster bacterium]MDP6302359.1 DNA-binding protein [SAR202 cluster bacterium]MDP7103693.1 DNA-binding protein [SAR202 cluster bacterium]MDP7225211.1 DNA-binding protein [SAR202 cluster bacterium]MDP7412564.1 DNA-binding protein [SAR202 cluster bacterium]|tara:strand:+ start:4911 stop:5318 length:408 start_codon:yes stop_codon:yes gene_type:complete
MSETWKATPSRVVYRRFDPGESLVAGLDAFARSEGIRSAIITSCIGSLSTLRLRNLCERDGDRSEFQWHNIGGILEIVSAEGYVQPLPDGEIRTHIHIVTARPSGELVGGHCDDGVILTGAFMYLQVLEHDEDAG